MSSEKMLYWVTLAVMTVLVGNHFASKYQGTCLVDGAIATVEHLGTEATHFAAMAESMFSETPSFARSQEAFARVQSPLAYVQASMARRQAASARQQAQHARMMALQQMQNLRVVCPRQSITVELPRIPEFISQ
jgi:hypothetical protein